MAKRQRAASDYSPGGLLRIRQTCLYVMSNLSPKLVNEITVVGGLVPSLLIDTTTESADQHLGTADLDIGLDLGLHGADTYEELATELRRLDFKPDNTVDGRVTGVRWKSNDRIAPEVLIDILPVAQADSEQSLNSEIPGLELSDRTRFAFRDRVEIEIVGPCLLGKERRVKIWVCGPGAYIIIKSLTFAQRNLYKDAYDLFYVLKNYGGGVQDVFLHLAPLLKEPSLSDAKRALQILHDEFADPNGDGATAVPLFLYKHPDENLQADVAGYTCQLLACFGMAP